MDDETWEAYSHYISKSRLSSMSFCPLKFKKNYIDGVRDDSPNFTLTTGTRFHNFAEAFFPVAYEYDPECWYDFIHEDFSPYERDMITWFIDREYERLQLLNNDIDLWMPVAREEKYLNHTLQLRGIIDRIDCIGDTYVIVEYKTGKSIYKPAMQKEFGFYVLLLKEDPYFKDAKFTGCVINPRVQEIQFITPSREDTILRHLEKLRTAIANNDFPPSCTPAKFASCQMCSSLEEANLYQEYKSDPKYVEGTW